MLAIVANGYHEQSFHSVWLLPAWKAGSLSWYLTQVSCPVITIGLEFFDPAAVLLSLSLSLSFSLFHPTQLSTYRVAR